MASLLFPAGALAEDQGAAAPELRWTQWPGATGGWGGFRSKLAGRGVDVFAQYTTGFWANTKGGFDTGIRYEGFATWGFGLDLERIVHWPGASFRMNWNSYHGGQPSQELIGQFPSETLSGWEAAVGVRFFEIALRQELWNDRIRIDVGQLTSDGEFYQSSTSSLLLNGTFGFLAFARQLTPFYPVAAPGVLVSVRTSDRRFELRSAIYTASAGDDTRENIGFDWSFDDGFTVFGEAIARPRLFGRLASFSIGVVGVRTELVDLSTGDRVGRRASLYGVTDLQIVQPGEWSPGLDFFARVFGTPEVGTSATDWYLSGGFALRTPFPGRDEDAMVVGFSYQRFGKDYLDFVRASGQNVTSDESIIELSYRAQVFRWFAVQPDLQLVIDPHFSGRNAVAIGLRGVIDL